MEIVRNIRAQDLPAHVQGVEIGEMLIQYRIEALAKFKQQQDQ